MGVSISRATLVMGVSRFGAPCVALALLLAACEPDSIVEVGLIDVRSISAPVSAKVGDAFFVSVSTTGGRCVELESTQIETTNEGGDFTPYDRRTIPGEGVKCTLILLAFHHEGSFTFDTPGTKTIRIHGRRLVGDLDEFIEIPLQVTIQ